MTPALARRLTAEAIGSFFLFAGVIGSGVMAEGLAQGNDALALLANTIATGAVLYVLIAMLGPISGAHFNPAVTLAFALRRELPPRDASLYVAVQLGAGVLGAFAVHLMFDMEILQFSTKARAGIGQSTGEFVATFGLVLTILVLLRTRAEAIPAGVALYITAAYWFTSSTSFANPAITVVRSLSDSFAGIAPADVPGFVLAQLAGTIAATALAGWLVGPPEEAP
ncbi:aquaporin family protein [Qipengyuania sp. YG27]|uniref:Aquaporin family protein n=2 Tax=Qipengyuania mesophila TaxID=2867246 RepID=A0ABS7JU01_9SPHN|nr:aquaporin family protein [Qipengyuania mesophila]